MQCPRLKHFVRINENGTLSRCGHMVNPPQFNSLSELENSEWLYKTKQIIWPKECIRCQETESLGKDSIRVHSVRFHQQQTKPDYLLVGGILDNICNSACLTCKEELSTKIGSLKSRAYPIIDNTYHFWKLPTHRIVHLDISGGEPSASKNYKDILQRLPANIVSVRINTNCSLIIDEIETLIKKGVKVTVTVSLDGIEEVHDFVRWPIKWDKFYANLMYYKSLDQINLNTWTTVSALNLHNFSAIEKFTADNKLEHSYAFLHSPDSLNVRYKNNLTEPFQNLFPGIVAVDRNNQEELDEYITQAKAWRVL